MNLNENLKMNGELTVTVRAEDGTIKQEFNVPNLVVTVGKNYIASRMASNSATVMSHMAIGTGTGAITEAGILNGSSTGTLLCRTTFPVVNKASSDSIAITWVITVS
jgi:hypothetical protein